LPKTVEAGRDVRIDQTRQRFSAYLMDAPIAFQAARKRLQSAAQIQCLDDLGQLLFRLGAPQPVPVAHALLFKDPDIPCQDDALLSQRLVDDVRIVPVAAVGTIETQHPQVARQFAEVHVEDEPRAAQRLWPQAQQRADVETLKHGVDRHALAPFQAMGEVHGSAIDQNQVDRRVRHADGLDHVAHRGTSLEGLHETDLAPLGGQKIVQLLVETELCHPQQACMAALRHRRAPSHKLP
jgi:hypothetical protein